MIKKKLCSMDMGIINMKAHFYFSILFLKTNITISDLVYIYQ